MKYFMELWKKADSQEQGKMNLPPLELPCHSQGDALSKRVTWGVPSTAPSLISTANSTQPLRCRRREAGLVDCVQLKLHSSSKLRWGHGCVWIKTVPISYFPLRLLNFHLYLADNLHFLLSKNILFHLTPRRYLLSKQWHFFDRSWRIHVSLKFCRNRKYGSGAQKWKAEKEIGKSSEVILS